MKPISPLLVLLACSLNASAATTLAVSDIMFAGYSSEGPTENFSFVTFVTLDAGTQIRFSDRPWTGSAFDTTNATADGEIVWSTSGTIAAGTVVVVSLDPTGVFATSATTGTATGDFGSLTGLSTAGEIIFAYQGSAAAPSFVHALNYRAVYDTPTAGDTLDSLKPSALGLANGDIVFADDYDNAEFTPRASLPSLAAYKAALSNPANWTLSEDDIALSTTPFTAVPEPAAASSLVAALGLLSLRRRRR